MPVAAFAPSRIHTDYTEWTAPSIAYNGQVWAWNNTSGKYEPTALSFDPAGTAAAAIATHLAAGNPHTQYALSSGLGTAATLNVGTSANNVVQLDGSARLPAVDGSQLTGITVAAAGSTTQVIYNNAGVYAGDAGMTYNASTDRLTVAGGLVAPSMRPASDSTTALQLQNASGTAVLTVDTTNRKIDLSSAQTLSVSNYLQTWTNSSIVRSRIDSRGAQYWFLSNTVSEVGKIEYATPGGSPGIVMYTGASYNLNRFNMILAGTYFGMGYDADGGLGTFIQASGGSCAMGNSTNTTPTAVLDLAASTTARASLRIRSGTAPTSPNDGDVWFDGTNYYLRSTTSYSVGPVVRTTAIRPVADSTTALQLQNAAGAAVVTVDTTNKRTQLWTGYFSERIETGITDLALGGRGLRWYDYAGSSSAVLVVANSGIFQYRHSNGAVINFPSAATSTLQAQAYEYLSSATYAPGFSTDRTEGAEAGIHGESGGVHIVTARTSRVVVSSDGLSAFGHTSPTSLLDLAASTTARASLRIRSGTAPTSPNDGDVWFNGTAFQCRIGGVTKTFTVT